MAVFKSFNSKPLAIILISFLGTTVYSNTLYSSFHFDDHTFIINNSAIRDIYNLQHIWQYYHGRFITFFSIALNYHFSGLNVFSYHLFNLGVHLVSAILVWWLTLLTLSTPTMKEDKIVRHANIIALFAGLVFVSHPVGIEAVTYIWQRAASMTAMFYLASLCLYVKSRLLYHSEPEGRSLLRDSKILRLKNSLRMTHNYYYFGSLIAAILAMFTKENAITLPVMILFYEFTFLNIKKGLDWKRISPFLFTIFIIPVTLLFIKSTAFQDLHGDLRFGGGTNSPMDYLLTQFRVMVTYIRLLFLPLNQNLDYDYPILKNIFELPVFISFLFLISILSWAKYLFPKYRLVSFYVFWFFLTLLPESSIWAMGDVIYEHRLYLPLAGYSMFLVSGVYYLLGSHTGHSSLFGKNSIKMMVAILTMIITFNSILTYQRNKVWKDEFTLWNDTVGKSPHKARPYINRGMEYCVQGDFTRAMSDFNKAIAIDPNDAEAYINRGNIYEAQGKYIKALIQYTEAIMIRPDYGRAYHNRALIYNKLGNFYRAISDATKVVEIDPHDRNGYITRGVIYSQQGNFNRAVSDFNKSIEIDPNYPVAYFYLGISYSKQGKLIQAISEFNKALEIDPNYKEAYNNRLVVYKALVHKVEN